LNAGQLRSVQHEMKVIGTWEKRVLSVLAFSVTGREWWQSQLCRVDLENVE
jgi:hypothetical protein